MSRRSRTDAYLRIWIKFSTSPQPESHLIELEQKIRGIITESGHRVSSLIFHVKDETVSQDEE